MAKNKQSPAQMYPVRCTECGDVIEGKFFPIGLLLKQYAPAEGIFEDRETLIRVLGIGAHYGQNVLPSVPKLLRKKKDTEGVPGGWEILRPDMGKLRSEKSPMKCFACKDNNDVQISQLTKVNLNIASIAAQFCLSTGSDIIYDMLEIQLRIRQKEMYAESASKEDTDRLSTLCNQFAKLPGVQLTDLVAQGQQENDIIEVLTIILNFALIEAEKDDECNFASETMMLGWRYQVINGIQMPHSLVVMGATSREAYDCGVCCCDKCRRELPREVGAYPQRIIGVLGSQQTGKTTYLATLTDAIDVGEATSYIQSNGDQQHADIKIDHNANDPQWKRVLAEPAMALTGEQKIGALWLYKNGYPPQKTNTVELEAPALTFLITDAKGHKVMYTLADIAGEAFTDNTDKYQNLKKLLYSSDALMVVVSTGQMDGGAKAKKNEKLVSDPSEILTSYKGFLPNKPIPTAVVMTSSDKINDGDLRQPLNLAFDIRRCRPLIWDGRKKHLVYNTEAMATATQAVLAYVNKYFGSFMKNLSDSLKQAGKGEPKVAAFAASSGTQCAPYYYGEEPDEAYKSGAQCKERYAQMRRERFGVTAPFLWLLACDGMLEIGTADTEYNDYSERIRKAIADHLSRSL